MRRRGKAREREHLVYKPLVYTAIFPTIVEYTIFFNKSQLFTNCENLAWQNTINTTSKAIKSSPIEFKIHEAVKFKSIRSLGNELNKIHKRRLALII